VRSLRLGLGPVALITRATGVIRIGS
jgi:hypothetical protein